MDHGRPETVTVEVAGEVCQVVTQWGFPTTALDVPRFIARGRWKNRQVQARAGTRRRVLNKWVEAAARVAEHFL